MPGNLPAMSRPSGLTYHKSDQMRLGIGTAGFVSMMAGTFEIQSSGMSSNQVIVLFNLMSLSVSKAR
jgi:hypothetical protein